MRPVPPVLRPRHAGGVRRSAAPTAVALVAVSCAAVLPLVAAPARAAAPSAPSAAPGAAACSARDVPVGTVQGAGAVTPLAGTTVTVQGTVVGDYQGPSPALRGFYLQDGGDRDRRTSDGVFVFTSAADTVSTGQVVQVTGTASEFEGQTQLGSATVEVCAPAAPGGGARPARASAVRPVDVRLPRAAPDDLEPYEGMLVRLPQTLTVTEHFQLGRFGQVVVSAGGRLRQPTSLYAAADPRARELQQRNALNRLIVDDGENRQNPDPIVFGRDGAPLSAANTLRGGDSLTGAVGVLTYTWAGSAASGNAFRLRPVGALGGSAVFAAANPRPTQRPEVGGSVRVAASNLLNYFDTFGNACTFGVGGAPAQCRGAGDAVELQRQTAKEVAALTSLDADVIAVVELENDGYGPGSAITDLVAALDAAQGAGTWAFVDLDAATGVVNAAGTDAIKNALLYRPARVSPVPGLAFADTAAGLFERNPVAQTFQARDGGRFTVVANHFKSKGSCPPATAPDAAGNVDSGDGQGCWNARRTAQAQRLADWLGTTVVPAAEDPDVLVLGDLNAYAQEDPLLALRSRGYTDLVRRYEGRRAYSYAFDGQWGYLDHALASPSLRRQVTGAAEHHVNADEPSVLDYTTDVKSSGQRASLYAPDPFRTSDHDPVVVGLTPRR